jgi:hypothetical protein
MTVQGKEDGKEGLLPDPVLGPVHKQGVARVPKAETET